jgi:type I restriction enzyme S subunit
MSLPRYPKYKDSGVEWLGEVPEHWSVKRIGAYFNERREKVSDADFPALSVTKNGIVPQLETAAKTDDGDNRKKVCVGDFVINSRSDRKGSSGESPLEGSVSLINTVLHPSSDVIPRFTHHLFRSYPFQEEYYRFGKGIVADLWSTNYSEMRNINIALPSVSEQSLIAEFIDRETEKIDALVEEQRRLIELLKEKRQAVISHAVTKGLQSQVEMTPKLLDWVGEVPIHWEVCPLRRIFRQVDYGISDSLDTDGAIAVLRMGNIQNGSIVFDDLKFIGSVDPSLLLESGDLLYNRTNSLDLIGKVGMFIGGFEFPVSFASYLVRLRLNEESIPGYFAYLLNTPAILGVARSSAFVAIGQCNLNPTRYSEIVIAVPPLVEQQNILEYLDRTTSALDRLASLAGDAIGTLRERRSALISAAVTGKIDVRGLAKESAA